MKSYAQTQSIIGKDIAMNLNEGCYKHLQWNLYLTGDIHKGTLSTTSAERKNLNNYFEWKDVHDFMSTKQDACLY
jgi:hypothetical protein